MASSQRSKLDAVFVIPGNHGSVYQALGAQFAAIEPPSLAGLFATYLRSYGCAVGMVDAPAWNLSPQAAAQQVIDGGLPRLVVVVVYGSQPSASTQTMPAAGEFCRALKELRPEAKILMTGTHPAALPERTLREEAIDFVCGGEGPVTILRTVEALRAGADSFRSVPGLWYRQGGVVMSNPAPALIEDLDGAMPGVAWDLMPMQRYRAHNWHCFERLGERQPYAAIHTTLGCPYRCAFCCINAPFGKPSYRMWSPDSVIAEIGLLVERHGVRNLKIVDEMFVLNRNHVAAICDRIIERGYDLNIWAYARVDTVNGDQLERMRRAGVRWLVVGIESGSQHVRDGVAKGGYGANDILRTVRAVQDAGIHVLGNYIFGLPDDSEASMQETLDLAIEANCEFANFYSGMAYPGSRLHASALAEGWRLPESWSGYSQHGYECTPLPTRELSSEQVLAFRDRAFSGYFSGRRYLDMVRAKFGAAVEAHVQDMTRVALPRKLLAGRPAELAHA